jgi:hypothetical protein
MEAAVRILLAALAIAVVAGTAYAQDSGGMGGGRGGKGRGGPQTDQQKTDPKKQKALEDAFKAGVSRIPDPKEKYDPWKNAR